MEAPKLHSRLEAQVVAGSAAGRVPFPISFGVAQKLELPLRTKAGDEELKKLFTTLTPGAAPQQSGPVFDGPFLDGLGLSLAHFPLCKSSDTSFCTRTVRGDCFTNAAWHYFCSQTRASTAG